MDPATVESVKESFLATLEPPSNFNDWLQGTHFSTRYISQLERTSTACTQAICASNVSIATSSVPLKGREKLLQQQVEKEKQKQKKLSRLGNPLPTGLLHDSSPVECSPTPTSDVDGSGKQECQRALGEQLNKSRVEATFHSEQAGQSVQESGGITTKEKTQKRKEKKGSKYAVQKRETRSPIVSKKQGFEDKTLKLDEKHTYSHQNEEIGGSPHSCGNGGMLTSAEIREHLRDSYYQMKSANAFGNTFPALLTPLNRPVFHMFDEWEQPQRKQEGRSGGRGGPFFSTSGGLCGTSPEGSGNPVDKGQWQDLTRGMLGTSEGRIDYPFQNEVLNQTCLRNLMVQPSGPPAFYPSATRPRRAPPKVMLRP